MKNLSISIFLYKDGLADSMLIAHIYIVIEGKFDGRSNFATLIYLPDSYMLPLILTALVWKLHEDSVEILVYWIRNYGLLLL